MSDVKHHPQLMSGGRHGSWCVCHCGWTSGTYRKPLAAHLSFGRHLLAAEDTPRHTPATPANNEGARDE